MDNLVFGRDIDNKTTGLQLTRAENATSSYQLTNDNIIYDFAGKLAEWTDQTTTKAGCPSLTPGPSIPPPDPSLVRRGKKERGAMMKVGMNIMMS